MAKTKTNQKGKPKKKAKRLPVGRPSVYDAIYEEKAYNLALLGATEIEIAKIFGITKTTLTRWKREHGELSASINRGRDAADANVANRLYQRAMGFEHDDEEIKVVSLGNGEGSQIERVKVRKVYPPDTAAAIFWLKNRQRGKWRDKVEQGFTDGDGNDVNPITIFKLPDNNRDGEAST